MKMKVSERFALEHWLSDYPMEMSYETIIKMLQPKNFNWRDDMIIPWEVIEDYPSDEIAEMIDSTRKQFEDSANNLVHGVALHDVMEGACDD
jgi:hypothetical protein